MTSNACHRSLRRNVLLGSFILCVTLAATFPRLALAEDSVDDFKTRKELADAEKAAIDAEAALEESRKKATAVPDAKAERNKDAIDSAKAAKDLADAEKARHDAELAAYKAKLGDVPSSGISGTVKTSAGAGELETSMLAAGAVKIAGEQIAKLVKGANRAGPVLVFTVGEAPTLSALTSLRAQASLAQMSLSSAIELSKASEKDETPALGAVGLTIEAASKLLGFFKTDFEVAGSTLTADDTLLARSVAGKIKAADSSKEVYLKSSFNPTVVTSVVTAMDTELSGLTSALRKAGIERRVREKSLAGRKEALAANKDDSKKLSLERAVAIDQQAVDALHSATTSADGLVTKVMAAPESLLNVARDLDIFTTLATPGSTVVLVKMDKAGGTQYTEKNVLTSLGAMPFKVAGGVVASFSMFDGQSGQLLGADVVVVHGGFKNVDEMGTFFPIK